MAEKRKKYPENAAGPFYVDSSCIACVSCVTLAPGHFSMVHGSEHSMVTRQPLGEAELSSCLQAMEVCPVGAIGNNGGQAENSQPVFRDLIVAALRRFGTRQALVLPSSGEALSYDDFAARLDKVMAFFQDQGLAAGEVVAISAENSLDLVAWIYGCMAWGAVAMPLNPGLAAAEVRTLLEHASAKLFVVSQAFDLPGLPCPQIPLLRYKSQEPLPRGDWESRQAGPEDGALLIYTSGTTGSPKGVLITQSMLASNVLAAAGVLGMDQDHAKLCLLPLFHTFGLVSDLSTAFVSGARCVIMEGFELSRLKRIEELLEEHSIRSFSAVPLIFELMLRFDCRLDGKSLAFAVSGAAPLSPKLESDFAARYGLPILPAYGLTEASCFCSLTPPGKGRPGTAGLMLAQLKILGEDGSELGPGQSGEIAVSGPGVMKNGYFKDSRPCYAEGLPGWFKTGDLGALSADGYLSITGRKKNMVIRGGEKIFLEDVDAALKRMPGVLDCASVRLDQSDGVAAESFACFVVTDGRPGMDAAAVANHLRGLLNPRQCPDQVFFSARIPRGATSKVRIHELRELALAMDRP